MDISGETKVCAILGDPVKHSLSPTMNNAAFKALDLDFVYVAFRVRREELKIAIKGARKLGIHGLNITMPHKELVMASLNEIDPHAKAVGAVNTILNLGKELVGYNTDGSGALEALRDNSVSLNGKKMLLLGAGGAGKAIAFQLSQELEELVILNRNAKKAENLAEVLRKKQKKILGNILSAKLVRHELKDSDILVNATSVGMHPQAGQSLVPRRLLRPDLCVMDIVYKPLETRLIRDATSIGAKVVNGVEMLVHQGAASFKILTNRVAPIQTMRQAALEKLAGSGTVS
ncbi:MAG: shikimate dehydrogenase [Candidatus Bathyarchaeota archaeon]|nr:shikimate dehydrogenase [Candidatus Bathyarchaeota archaeon]